MTGTNTDTQRQTQTHTKALSFVLQNIRNKTKNCMLFFLPKLGFEPQISCSPARCSYHLSYWGTHHNSITDTSLFHYTRTAIRPVFSGHVFFLRVKNSVWADFLIWRNVQVFGQMIVCRHSL